jgi:type II secretory pathway component PulF
MLFKSLQHMNVGSMNGLLERWLFTVSPKQRAEFFEMMGALIKDGKPLDSSLRELQVRYTQKKRRLASLLTAWSSALSEGKTFATALTGYASETEVIIIAACEKSGDLVGGFSQAALVARSSAAIRSTLIEEMMTPGIQLLILLAMLIGFSTGLAPQLVQSVPMSAMDDSQRLLLGLAAVIASTWYLIVPALVAVAYFALWSMPRYMGALRPFLDRIPPWSVYRVYSSATFMIALSALIKSGVPIETAIRFIKQQSSPWLKDHLSVMIGRLRAGVEQGSAMDTGLLSDRLADMVAIYSRTADFDAAVSSIGKISMEDGLANIKTSAGFAKTIATIAIGALVGWIFLSMLGISDAAQRANNQTQQAIVR